MKPIEKLKTVFDRAIAAFGYYHRHSDHRVTGIDAFEENGVRVKANCTARYFLKAYDRNDGKDMNVAVLVQGRAIPRPMLMPRHPNPPEEFYSHTTILGSFSPAAAKTMLAEFDSGKPLKDIVAPEGIDDPLLKRIVSGEERFGVKAPSPNSLTSLPRHPALQEMGYK